MKVLVIFGTRPEAVKMAPLVATLLLESNINVKVCITGQHRGMLDQVLSLFEINPDYDLDIMSSCKGLTDITCEILKRLDVILKEEAPSLVLVHGDTTTTLAASLASYYQQIPVVHIEAGLRTNNIYQPWPEEGNRKIVGAISCLHFAPTESSRVNLLSEGIEDSNIVVSGNTVVDALFSVSRKIDEDEELQLTLSTKFNFLREDSKIVLVTGHRRESFGAGFDCICQALLSLAKMFPEVEFVYPVHLNPNVQKPVYSTLSGISNIHLIDPLEYIPFIYLMKRSFLILTDSGGIQEEAPTLGKPVLVMRDVTERPEAVRSGVVKLVGTDPRKIIDSVKVLISDTKAYQKMANAHNPYGDGKASLRIVHNLLKKYK